MKLLVLYQKLLFKVWCTYVYSQPVEFITCLMLWDYFSQERGNGVSLSKMNKYEIVADNVFHIGHICK